MASPGRQLVRPEAPAADDPNRVREDLSDAVGSPAKGWALKVAVLLVVAALCIAFAGLLWALIF